MGGRPSPPLRRPRWPAAALALAVALLSPWVGRAVAGEPSPVPLSPAPVPAEPRAQDQDQTLEPPLWLSGPFGQQGGQAWMALPPQDWPGDGPDGQASTLVLLEDGRPLGPAHALHDLIRETGGGAYSHWGRYLWFSTSDGSDPNTNGRRYEITRPVPDPVREGWRLLPVRDPFVHLPPRSAALGAAGAAGLGLEPAAGDDAPPTIYWYVIDALRPDAANELRDDGPLMPALDAFRQQAVSFTRAYAPSSFTKTSTASMFTGLWPQRHGVLHGYLDTWPDGGALTFDLDRRFDTLAQVLADVGYDTWTHDFTIHVQPGCGLLAGFEHLDLAIGADDPVPGAEPRLFAYEHVLGVHGPYDPSPAARARLGLSDAVHVDPAGLDWFQQPLDGAQLAELRDAYRAEAVDADADLGRRLQWLRDSGRWDDALVIVTADHGEAFGEHGSTQHSVQLYDEVLHVPLLIKFPADHRWAAWHGQAIDARVRLIDLYPTLVELAVGDERPRPYALDGRSLAPLLDGAETGPLERDVLARVSFTAQVEGQQRRALFVQDAVLVDRLKAHMGWRLRSSQTVGPHQHRQGEWVAELYDLRADPGETDDLAARHPAWMERLAGVLAAAHGPLRLPGEAPRAAGDDGGPDADLTRNLQALGYLEGGATGEDGRR